MDYLALGEQIGGLAAQAAERAREIAQKRKQASEALTVFGTVNSRLRSRIALATAADVAWRGCEPLGGDLRERHALPVGPLPLLTIIAMDGSQTYPDRHGLALYYLISSGGLIFREASGRAPDVVSQVTLHYEERELQDGNGNVRTRASINAERDRAETQLAVALAEWERVMYPQQPILVLADGPLVRSLPKLPPSGRLRAEIQSTIDALDRLRAAGVLPVGYVDRPGSAALVRLLELAAVPHPELPQWLVARTRPLAPLSDRMLLDDLRAGERTGLFASTSVINHQLADAGHRIVFCYVNVSPSHLPGSAVIARVEMPEWVADDAGALDLIQSVLADQCQAFDYPYALIRAHEIAVIRRRDEEQIRLLVGTELARHGVQAAVSAKQRAKDLLK